MIDAQKLADMASELASQAIRDIHDNWHLEPKSPAAMREPVKFSLENTIRYNMAKMVVDIYQKAKADANSCEKDST